MKPKKTDHADLESKRGIFLQIGLIIALGMILAAFEWSSSPTEFQSFVISEGVGFEEESIPPTREEVIKPPPPPALKVADILSIIDDDELIDDEAFFRDNEPDPDMEIDITPFIEVEKDDTEEMPYIRVEEMPKFQGGGLEEFRMWVLKNLRYPEIAAENGVSGKVYVNFVVNAKGQVENAIVLKGADPALDQESLRVVMASPKWEPGKQRDKTVRVQFTLPIHFVLQ